MNLQKSQFVGIVKSRAGHVFYPIAEDIAETKNVAIYNYVLNGDLQLSYFLSYRFKWTFRLNYTDLQNVSFLHSLKLHWFADLMNVQRSFKS